MMKHVERSFLIQVLLLSMLFAGCHHEEKQPALWPHIEPFETGYLKVSDLHEIYYELSGNREGRPVFVLHGGPGGSTSPYYRRFCDPDRYLIVLHDQRGAGKSRPSGELRENNTSALVEDIEKLRTELDLDKIILFGGSWGTTLALVYAERYPDRTAGLVLRGLFTCTKEEIDHFYHGGAAKFFPETYDRFLSDLPSEARGADIPVYLDKLLEENEPPAGERYCRAWARYEIKMAALQMPDENVEGILSDMGSEAVCTFARFESRYMANGCFLEEGQLLRDAGPLSGIPTFIVNGRYDVICPPENAYRLHRLIKGSELKITEGAGHWMGEPDTERALVELFERWSQLD